MGKLRDAIEAQIDNGATQTLVRAVESHGDTPGYTTTGDALTVTGDVFQTSPDIDQPTHPDIASMLAMHNLSEDEWEPQDNGITINNWPVAIKLPSGQPIRIQLWQFKVKFCRKPQARLNVISCPGHMAFDGTEGSERRRSNDKLVCVLSDQQVAGSGTGYDPELHELVLRWIDYNRPYRCVLTGDLINGTAGSQWPQTIDELASGNSELAAGHRLIGEYRSALGSGARIDFIEGNHEHHYMRAMLKKCPELATLRPAGDLSSPTLISTRNLLQLDKLGVNLVEGPYPHGELWLTNELSCRHGWIASAGAGSSALKTLEQVGHSVIVGHTIAEESHTEPTFLKMEVPVCSQQQKHIHYAKLTDVDKDTLRTQIGRMVSSAFISSEMVALLYRQRPM